MQAIIVTDKKDIELYNGETTTNRIIRLLTKNNISYKVVNKIPESILAPAMIIDNNIVFNEKVLEKNINKEGIFNLKETTSSTKYRIRDDYEDTYINEITDDNKDTINKELRIYDLVSQKVIKTDDYFEELKNNIKLTDKLFIVSTKSQVDNITKKLKTIPNPYHIFTEFNPNPTYDDIIKGRDLFLNLKYDCIVAIGGGSTIDTAKCIKAFTNIKDKNDVIDKNYKYSGIKLIAIPTTSGTGSESTEVGIMYFNGEKLSVDHPSDLPDVAILDHNFLITLPLYQKKCVMIDALCQSIEAFWSKNRTDLSKSYSKRSIELIINNYKGYLNNDINALKNIMYAANLSGKAITLSKTCAPHTMCYRLTTKYNIAHGHAVSLTLIPNWKLIETRGDANVQTMLLELSKIIGFDNISQSIIHIENLINELNLPKPKIEDTYYLVSGVDIDRLKNHPIELNKEDLKEIYNTLLY